jgi:hypothetical protein
MGRMLPPKQAHHNDTLCNVLLSSYVYVMNDHLSFELVNQWLRTDLMVAEWTRDGAAGVLIGATFPIDESAAILEALRRRAVFDVVEQ